MIIDFESLPSIGVTSENEGHEKPNERNFGSQSRPVGNISPVCCFSSGDEIGCLVVEDTTSVPITSLAMHMISLNFLTGTLKGGPHTSEQRRVHWKDRKLYARTNYIVPRVPLLKKKLEE